MLKKLFIALSALFLLGMSTSLSFAEPVDKSVKQGVISASGIASVEAKPDIAYVSVSIQTQAKTADKAGKLNSVKSNAVIKKVASMLDKEEGESIKTSSYSIYPNYYYNNSRKKRELAGYTATNRITITTKQVNNLGQIIDAAVESGANKINNVNFGVSANNEYCKKVIIQATEKAKGEASVLAQALGVRIVGIKQASSSCGSSFPQPLFRSSFAGKTMKDEAAPTPIEPGNIKINGSVNVEFYIKK